MFQPFEKLELEIFGESHAPEIGVKLRGLPRGEKIDLCELKSFIDRRKSGANAWSTPRRENDEAEIVSGLDGGVTTGGELVAIIKNKNAKSGDYSALRYTPRPSHADYVSAVKDGTGECPAGGGRFSGRMTAPLCVAGGVCKQLLLRRGVEVLSYIRSIGGVVGDNYVDSEVTAERIKSIETPLKALSRADEMTRVIADAAKCGDSVGGAVDCIIFGMPVGVGDNLFNGLEGRIALAVYGVPAVKGVEFGAGFKFAGMRGSRANDFFAASGGKIVTETNNSGGVNGGISNGMPITLSAAFRPTPSISLPQKTVDLRTGEQTTIIVGGRHDSCVAVRGAVAVEAAAAIAVLDAMI